MQFLFIVSLYNKVLPLTRLVAMPLRTLINKRRVRNTETKQTGRNENGNNNRNALRDWLRRYLTPQDMRKWIAAQSALRHQTKTSSEKGAARLPRWSQRGNKVSHLLVINSYFCAVDDVFI